jgi:hypothetical protein
VRSKTKLTFQLRPTFFGLNSEYLENVYEQIFLLQYHCNWSFTEAYNLPVKLREWFVSRLVKQKEDENAAVAEGAAAASNVHELGAANPTAPGTKT